ncbi:glycosyltransferase [Ruegeria sp. HKCCD4884]|uniref:glycosyltransferase n=1 Tax=Ruegeria sp. HKCCD4884 TaxID=2683022 RepID=UPI00149218F8|nr:glycosyltransferase [Ruegeria sp. HKCCD4884]NOD95181.1 glycosyltransferase [Ruegeria sp. HKCCD4884]
MKQAQISVIIPCVNSLADFRTCMAALQNQTGPQPEVIAVERLGPEFVSSVRSEFPEVHVLSVAADATIPHMRAVGIRSAGADAIGMIEDHVIVPQNWTERMLAELAAESDVVAGPVDNVATDTLIDWAAFLCEYSAVLPPLKDGPSDWLPGNNTVYRRDVLQQFDSVLDDGKWENHLHDRMRAEGVTLILRNDIVAGHKMHYTFGLYMAQRYLYSKSFAGARVRGEGLGKRFLMGCFAFALPPLVYVRVVRNILSKRQHVRQLLLSLPLLVPFSLSWGAGEIAGYWFGAGQSLSKVR